MTEPGGGRGDDVSAELRRRVMLAVRAEPKRVVAAASSPRRRFPVAGALALVGMLGVLVVAGRVELQPDGSPVRVIPASVGFARLRVSAGRGEMFVTHLPPPPADRVYQLWLERGTGAPAPSTLFTVTSQGTADVALPGYAAGVTRVLVTVEPAGGSPAPTSRPLIVAPLV
jgi:anti-sigma-K factor RskA